MTNSFESNKPITSRDLSFKYQEVMTDCMCGTINEDTKAILQQYLSELLNASDYASDSGKIKIQEESIKNFIDQL